MARSLLSQNPTGLHHPFSRSRSRPCFAPPHPSVEISVSAHRCRLLAIRAVQPSSPNGANPSQGDANATNSDTDVSPTNMSARVRWALGAIFFVAIPFYKQILGIEDEVEKTTVTVLDTVEKIAETTEKVSSDVADALPEKSELKQVALRVGQMAEVVDKDAEVAESFVKKVDEVVDEFDNMVEPIIQGDIKVKDGQEKKKNDFSTKSKKGELNIKNDDQGVKENGPAIESKKPS